MKTKDRSVTDQRAALYATPARRPLEQLARFEAALTSALEQHLAAPRTHAGHFLYKADGRTPLFYLEGLARCGKAVGPKRGMWNAWLPRFKEIEDRIGVYDYWYDLEQRGTAWKLQKPLLGYFGERKAQALGAMEYALHRSGWWLEQDGTPTASGPILDALRESIGELHWPKPKAERKLIATFLRDEVAETIAKLDDGTINLDKVELGIHELRRQLRWVPIYGLAMRGKIVLDERSHDGPLSHYVTPEMLAHPFNQLPEHPDEPNPVRLHTGAFLAVSLLITEIGKLKDRALWTQEIERSSQIVGINPAHGLKRLGAETITHAKVVERVSELVQKVIVGDEVLIRLAEHLDAQI